MSAWCDNTASLYFSNTVSLWHVQGWRRRLVEWIRNLNVHFQLLPPVLADAVALADRYIYSHGRTKRLLLSTTIALISNCVLFLSQALLYRER
jgi:hypothetical protein